MVSVIDETDAIANLSRISFVCIDFSMFDSDEQNGMTALTVVEWKNSFSKVVEHMAVFFVHKTLE